MNPILLLIWSFLFMPEFQTEKKLFTLQEGESIVYNESRLLVGAGGGGYSIITKIKGKFFINTEKGRTGPLDKLPEYLLPKGGLTGSSMQQFQETKTQPEMGYTSDGKMQIKLGGKVVGTLEPGHIPAAVAEDPVKKRLAFISMVSDENTGGMNSTVHLPGGKKIQLPGVIMSKILVNPATGTFLFETMDANMQKVYYTEAGNKVGPYGNYAQAYDLNGSSVIIMDPDQQTDAQKVYRDGKSLYTLKRLNSSASYIFNADASKYAEINYKGINLSDGKLIERAFVPTVETKGGSSTLHYLQVNASKEVVLSSIPW
ncbi:hypothetical protein GCM10027036_35000 [Flavihumibacter cheonanensis]|uniref:hypothetical protein n=1 Tax=Flavihumibacter cheonanensis TaxID=1442385 RepID=UPI001EF8CB19|nr:hypothetical protein [Flavihumibacter cheonanensis]MCG7753504.1 hypothetical protein [Flavihumibacter cheonanensis]